MRDPNFVRSVVLMIQHEEQGALGVVLTRPGDKSEIAYHPSDNDGLWTSMYGAGECFAFAATKNPKAKAFGVQRDRMWRR